MASAQQRSNPAKRRLRRMWLAIGVVAAVCLAVLAFAVISREDRFVVVRADGREYRLPAQRVNTVGQALRDAGVHLADLDRVSLPLSSRPSSTPIVVVRVEVTEAVHSASIPFLRLTTPDPRLPRGYRRIVQSGVAGAKEVRESVTTEDGLETRRAVVGEQVLRPATDEITLVGARDDPALDAFRDSALGYLGRGGVTRLSPSVVEQTVFELARLRGDRYGSVRVLPLDGRPWLVLATFARSANDTALFVFWWADELHAFAQVIDEGTYLLEARAQQTATAAELGLVVSPGQGSDTLAPQYLLLRLPLVPETADTWRTIWTSQAVAAWRSSQGSVAFAGEGLDQLEVRGASSSDEQATAVFADCVGCPRRRFESMWQRQGEGYAVVSQGVTPSPYAALWDFTVSLRSGSISTTLAYVSDSSVISAAVASGLSRPDVRWTVSGRETDTVFDLRSKDGSLRVTLATQAGRWVVTAIGPVPAQGKILYTGTRPVVRGLFVTDTAAAAPPRTLGDGARYAWSPDYARVAYDWQGLVYVVDSDGGNPKLVGPGTAPAWSPDGQRLAIERGSNTGPQIVVVTLTDGSERVLVAGSRPTWAPKQAGVGERIAYSFTGSAAAPPALYVVDVAGGAVSVLASDGAEPIWSPDGGAVAFLTSRQEIAVVTLNPAVVRTVGSGGGYTWSSDGKRLAFLSATPAGAPIVWDRERTETRKLLERSDVDGLSWSPDGTEIVLSLASGNGLWLAASDGSNLRKLGDGRDPMWASSPRAGR